MRQETVYLGIQDIWPIALVLVVTGVGVAFGFSIIDDVDNSMAECRTDGVFDSVNNICYNGTAPAQAAFNHSPINYAWNATAASSEGIDNMAQKIPTVALVVVAAILIGILVRNLGVMS